MHTTAKITLLCFGLMAMIACSNSSKTPGESTENQVKADTPRAIGGQKDEHGCNPATGATWSELKQDCIQVFNVGTRLNPVGPKEGEAVISAFVLYNDDKSKAELFLAQPETANVILNKAEGGVYQGNRYKYDTKEGILYINGEKKFQIEK